MSQSIASRMRCLPPLSLPALGRFEPVRFRFISHFLLWFCLYCFILRAALTIRSWDQINHTLFILVSIFSVGLFYDFVSGLYCAIPLILYLTFVPQRFFTGRWQAITYFPFVFSLLYLLGFTCMAEWLFWEEFSARFNFIAVDYLVYTHEVIGNILESYPVFSLLAGLGAATAALVFCCRSYLAGLFARMQPAANRRTRLGGRLVVASVLIILPFTSYFAVNGASFLSIFGNRYEKELAENGIFQLFTSFRDNKLDYNTFYQTRDESEVYQGLRNLLKSKNSIFLTTIPTDISRLVSYAGEEKHPNVVLVMMESMSAKFLSPFGNLDNLTPNLDRLSQEGMLFTRMYATGTRTVRGMEAVTLSVPPTPGRSIVKRPENANMFSMGTIFRDKDYDATFFYGGLGYLDNMNAFFANNGFSVIDRNSLQDDEISFANIWGVCDEDIYKRAIREFDQSHDKGRPFLGYIMTTSNHRPFTYPEGRVEMSPGSGRAGAVMYADYAIGAFMEEARRHPWFDDTVFLFIADHCAGSAGRVDVPIHRYHIPFIIYGPKFIEPGVVDLEASQVDVVPTLLGLLNWNYRTKLFGKNILESDYTPRAFVGNYEKLGYLENDLLTVLDVHRDVHQYMIVKESLESETVEMLPTVSPLTDKAISYYQGASLTYKKYLERWRMQQLISPM